jgi:nucleotide-binding universal stress UspA family protein
VESSAPARVLVVAAKTAATPALIEAVRERAARGPARFTLLVPNPTHGLHAVVDPEDQGTSEAEAVVELAVPLLEEAAGSKVDHIVGDPQPLNAIQDAVNLHGFDEIILSTLPTRVSRWLKLDLPSKVAGLGLPVTTVTARSKEDAATAT